MKRFLLAGVVSGFAVLTGCGFAQGFKDEGARQLAEFAISETKGLKGEAGELATKVIDAVTPHIPKPNPLGEGLLYTLGGLAAYIMGSYGKGKIREARAKKASAA